MKDLIIALIPVVVAVFGSTGFWSYMQSKKDKTKDVLDAITSIKKDLDGFKNKYEETEAMNCRNRIVRFADEIRIGKKASKDYYDHILKDCDHYERYCDAHPQFENNIAKISMKKIKEHYEQDDFM